MPEPEFLGFPFFAKQPKSASWVDKQLLQKLGKRGTDYWIDQHYCIDFTIIPEIRYSYK